MSPKRVVQPKSFRLTEEAVDLLHRCAESRGLTDTAALELAIRELAATWLLGRWRKRD